MTDQSKTGEFSLLALSGGPGLAEKAALEAEEKARQEAEDQAFQNYCYRRLARFKQWAMKQDKEALAEHLSLAALLLIEKKKTEHVQMRINESRENVIEILQKGNFISEAREAAAREVAKEYMEKWANDRASRRRGAKAKLLNDKNGKQAAKAVARELWPVANRNGWPAHRLQTELSARGFNVATDTVRKWVTKLRKTGTC